MVEQGRVYELPKTDFYVKVIDWNSFKFGVKNVDNSGFVVDKSGLKSIVSLVKGLRLDSVGDYLIDPSGRVPFYFTCWNEQDGAHYCTRAFVGSWVGYQPLSGSDVAFVSAVLDKVLAECPTPKINHLDLGSIPDPVKALVNQQPESLDAMLEKFKPLGVKNSSSVPFANTDDQSKVVYKQQDFTPKPLPPEGYKQNVVARQSGLTPTPVKPVDNGASLSDLERDALRKEMLSFISSAKDKMKKGQ